MSPHKRLETHLLWATDPPKEVHRPPSRQRNLWSRRQHQAPSYWRRKILRRRKLRHRVAVALLMKHGRAQIASMRYALSRFQQTPEYNLDPHPNLGGRLNGFLLAVLLSHDKKVLPPAYRFLVAYTVKGHWGWWQLTCCSSPRLVQQV